MLARADHRLTLPQDAFDPRAGTGAPVGYPGAVEPPAAKRGLLRFGRSLYVSTDEEALKRRYREFLDLLPLTMAIAGLPTSDSSRRSRRILQRPWSMQSSGTSSASCI